MHTTHKELKYRINYFGSLPIENHIFRVEESNYKGVDPPFTQMDTILQTNDSQLADLHLQEENDTGS
jgi:hypothetical protein